MTGTARSTATQADGWLPETGRTMRLALPMIGAYTAELGMWWTDQAIVGRLGAQELAAVGLSGSVLFQGVMISMGVLSIVAVLVGNAFGADRPEGVARAVRQGMKVATVLSAVVMVYAWFVPQILAATGQDPAVVALAADYVRPFVLGVPPMLYFTVLRGFVAGVSRPLVVTLITVAAIPVNLVINLVLVFGAEAEIAGLVVSVPAYGVPGAAWGSVLVTWLMLGALWLDAVWMPASRRYRVLADPLGRDREEWRTIWRLGFPVGLLTLLEGGMFMAIGMLAGVIGVATLAANQVAGNLISFSAIIAMGLGEAASVRVAQEIGGGRPRGARHAGFVAIGMGCVVSLVFAVVLVTVPELLAAIFLDVTDPENAAALSIVAVLAPIAAAMLVFDGSQMIASRALRGLHDTVMPAWISAVGYWVLGIPIAALLAFDTGLEGAGLWLGLAAGLAVAAVWLTLRFDRISKARARSAAL